MLESASRGGGLPGPGVSAWSGGVSAWSGGGVSAWSGGWGGLPCPGGVCLVPPCGQTHTCKNITLSTTSLRPVIKKRGSFWCTNVKTVDNF